MISKGLALKVKGRSGAALLVVLTALLFSSGGAAIKFASVRPWQVAGLRSLIAFAVLFLLVPAVRRRWSAPVWLLGLPYAGVMLLFVHANTRASAASVTLLQATAPLYVMLLAPWWLKQRFSRQTLLLLPLFLAGMLLLLSDSGVGSTLASSPILGRALGAGAGLCFGLIILGLTWAQQVDAGRTRAQDQTGGGGKGSSTAIQAVAWGNLLAGLVALPFMLRGWDPLEVVDFAVVAYLGVFQIGLAYVLLLAAMRMLEALQISLLLLLELVASPIFAGLLHGETVGVLTVAGGLFILAGCGLNASWAR